MARAVPVRIVVVSLNHIKMPGQVQGKGAYQIPKSQREMRAGHDPMMRSVGRWNEGGKAAIRKVSIPLRLCLVLPFLLLLLWLGEENTIVWRPG